MHKSLVQPVLGLTLASLFSSAAASPLQRRQQLQCVQDDIYIGLWENDTPDYYKDVQRFCASELGETVTTECLGTNTGTSTIYADATATETVTSPTYVAASTVTVISTAVNFELRKRGPQPAPVTAAYGMIKRQASATPSYNTVSALLSACACGNPDPGTTSEVCTATSTRTVNGFFKTTVYTPVTVASTTTITETVNVTQSINTSISVASATPTSSWSLNWGDWSSTTSGAASSSSANSTIQVIEPSYVSTTTTSAVPSVTPSGCPAEDGSIFSSNSATCYDYEYVCGRTYADSDFSDEFRYPTPEACTSVCDAQNAGSGPGACLGIVWNTTAAVYNCRTLKSLDSPLDDAASVALLLVPNASCGNTSSSTTSSTTTRSRPSGTMTGPWGINSTGIWPTGSSWTSRPTGWSSKHTYNSTSYTISPVNTTTPMSSYTPSSGTGTGMPTMTSNSTCPASTVTSNYTITAVIISSVTQYANATTTFTDFVTNTVVETATSIKTKKTASTVTVTQATTDTKTITETDFVNATATVTANASTITITQTTTSTETDTETTTETDTVTTTKTNYLGGTATVTSIITSIPDAITTTITPTASTITIIEESTVSVSVTIPGLTITETDMGATITLAASTETDTTTTTVAARAAPTTTGWIGKMGRKWVAWN